jgi:flagellar motility protein MotE (MotC chaperone)
MSQSRQNSAERITELRRQEHARKQNPAIAEQSIADVKQRIATAKEGIAYWEKLGKPQGVIDNRNELKQAEADLARLEKTLPPDDAA